MIMAVFVIIIVIIFIIYIVAIMAWWGLLLGYDVLDVSLLMLLIFMLLFCSLTVIHYYTIFI